VNEHGVAPRRVGTLDNAVPALVATSGAERHDEATIALVRRRLDLDSIDSVAKSAIRS
jgi:hypothetical protein